MQSSQRIAAKRALGLWAFFSDGTSSFYRQVQVEVAVTGHIFHKFCFLTTFRGAEITLGRL